MLIDPIFEVLAPLCAANETILLGIPARDQDGAKRSPAPAQKGAETADDLVDGSSTRGGVGRAHDPS